MKSFPMDTQYGKVDVILHGGGQVAIMQSYGKTLERRGEQFFATIFLQVGTPIVHLNTPNIKKNFPKYGQKFTAKQEAEIVGYLVNDVMPALTPEILADADFAAYQEAQERYDAAIEKAKEAYRAARTEASYRLESETKRLNYA